jgi:hypothetical protein
LLFTIRNVPDDRWYLETLVNDESQLVLVEQTSPDGEWIWRKVGCWVAAKSSVREDDV